MDFNVGQVIAQSPDPSSGDQLTIVEFDHLCRIYTPVTGSLDELKLQFTLIK